MKLEPRYKKIFKEMQEQGKVTTLSQEETYRIDHQLAMRLLPIKEEFNKKERASRNYASKLELKTAEI